MSSIRLIRKNGYSRRTTPGVPVARQPLPAPRLGPDWWSRGWIEATEPIDNACRRLCGHWLDAWNGNGDYADDPDGVVFVETMLGEDLPAELMAAVLHIPDEFAAAGNLLVLRKVDDGGVPGVRVCGADGGPIGSITDPDTELFRVDTWMTWAAHWLLALGGARPGDIERLLRRELP